MGKREELSRAQQAAVEWINSKSATKLGPIGQEVGKMLAEICVELMDAKQEAAHWKAAFETIQAEFKVAVGLTIRKQGGEALVVTRADLATMPANTELWLDDREPGVRAYSLREIPVRNPSVDGAVRRLIQTH